MPSSVPIVDGDRDGQKRRPQRDLRAVEDAAEEIAAEMVGAERMLPSSGGAKRLTTSSALGGIGRDQRRKQRGQHGERRRGRAPIRPVGLRTMRRRTLVHGFAAASAAVRRRDARIEPGIGQVDEKVGQHEEEHDDQHAGLHDGIVARVDGVVDQRADAGPREDDLGEDRAAEQAADAEAEHRHRRDRGILQRVFVDDLGVGDARRRGWCGCRPRRAPPAARSGRAGRCSRSSRAPATPRAGRGAAVGRRNRRRSWCRAPAANAARWRR